MYTGKGTLSNLEKRHTFEVMSELIQNQIKNRHTLFLGNFYNSVDLSEHVIEKKTNMCGILQTNRVGNPEVVVSAKLKNGQCVSRQKGFVTVMKWKDIRDVLTKFTTQLRIKEDRL